MGHERFIPIYSLEANLHYCCRTRLWSWPVGVIVCSSVAVHIWWISETVWWILLELYYGILVVTLMRPFLSSLYTLQMLMDSMKFGTMVDLFERITGKEFRQKLKPNLYDCDECLFDTLYPICIVCRLNTQPWRVCDSLEAHLFLLLLFLSPFQYMIKANSRISSRSSCIANMWWKRGNIECSQDIACKFTTLGIKLKLKKCM